jgi:tripartite ATP-independent transporter DctM subunit
MEWYIILLFFFGSLMGLMMAGVNVFVAFLLVNLTVVTLLIGDRGFGLFTNSVLDSLTTGSYATIPLFILMGEILFRSGSVDVLFDSIDRLVGRIRGRLYAVVILIATVFGALSGSAIAVTAMLGRSALPIMTNRGYSTRLSTSVILAGASLAPIIPPSLLAIIIGSMANVSISGLLIAGIVPGIMISTLIAIYVAVRITLDPTLAPENTENDGTAQDSAAGAVLKMMPFVVIIASVMGFIILGIATPGESAAIGVLGAIGVAAIYKRLSLNMVVESVSSATSLSVMILIIVASSTLFGQLLAFTGASRALVSWATELGLSPMVMFALMMALPLVLCMFIDQVAFLLLAVPLYDPIIGAMGFDPIWFWTIFLINLTIGGVSPPFGYTLFAFSGAAPQIATATLFRASLPVVAIFTTAIILLAFFPQLTLWLPSKM